MARPDHASTAGRHVVYQYMFARDKLPTPQLDALLRGIASSIIDEIGDKQVKALTPQKLAAFYKAVGGNYDELFVDRPDSSISYIYSSIGCEHSLLQPPGNHYALPSIPALTARGFARWQSIEILLEPEQHVPFMQRAVKNLGIRNPETNELFPPLLPSDVFPDRPDAEIEKWHTSCAEKLHKDATPDAEPHPAPPRRPKVHVHEGFAYVPAPRPTRHARPAKEYFSEARPAPVHRVRPFFKRSSLYHGVHSSLSPDHAGRPRRQSFPVNSSSPDLRMPSPIAHEKLRPSTDARNRRHSHPRHTRTPSTTSASDDDSGAVEEKSVPLPKSPKEATEARSHAAKHPHPPDQSPWSRFNLARNLHPDTASPRRSNSHSTAHVSSGTRYPKTTSDDDSERSYRRSHRTHAHRSTDATSSLSAPFMPTPSSHGGGGGYTSRPVSGSSTASRPRRDAHAPPPPVDVHVRPTSHHHHHHHPHHPGSRRMSFATDDDYDDDDDDGAGRPRPRKRPERSARSRDRGKTDRQRREKERERRERGERGRERAREGSVGGGGGGPGGGGGVRASLLSRSASIGARLGLPLKFMGIGVGAHEERERERERGREERLLVVERARRARRASYGSRAGSPGGDAGLRYPVDGVIRR